MKSFAGIYNLEIQNYCSIIMSSGRFDIYLSSICRCSQYFIEFLVAGINSRKPTESVKNPGDSSTSPAITISRASRSSPEGILPSRRLSCIRYNVCRPCIRARKAPKNPVRITRVTAVNAPKIDPISISRNISIIGMIVKARNNLSSI